MIRIDPTPHKRRAGMSPAAYAVHCILTSPSAKKHGLGSGQEHVLRCCAKVLSADDRRQLDRLGHAEALQRHCRVQAQLEQDDADQAWAEELQRRKDEASQRVAEYVGEGS